MASYDAARRMVHPDFSEWLAYCRPNLSCSRRAMPVAGGHASTGRARECWNNYVYDAFVNHQADAIYLAGLPDIPEAALVSKVLGVNDWKAPASLRQKLTGR